jgi:hypothetical protein
MTRLDDMLARYGETVSQAKAGRILGKHPNTIHNMIVDGRLKLVCGGTQVDVRSIAEYIGDSRRANTLARLRKKGEREWLV